MKLDCGKVGDLLYRLRREKNLTQKQVADQLNISDKTVSKWERGLGCPDVSLLGELSGLFGVNIRKILAGNLEANGMEAGNLRRIRLLCLPNLRQCHQYDGPRGYLLLWAEAYAPCRPNPRMTATRRLLKIRTTRSTSPSRMR